MNTEQQKAYEWAKNQNYQSVAARNARLLAEALDDLQAAYDEINIFENSQCMSLLLDLKKERIENIQLRIMIEHIDSNFFTRKCRICGCSWNHPCEGGCSWIGDDLCSQCFQKGLKR